MIINENFLKDKYSKDEAKVLIQVFENLRNAYAEDVNAALDAEEITEVVVRLKLDANSACASVIFPFAKLHTEAIEKFAPNKEVAKIFHHVLQVENCHHLLLEELYTKMKSNKLYKMAEINKWKCSYCGVEIEQKEAPKNCPLC